MVLSILLMASCPLFTQSYAKAETPTNIIISGFKPTSTAEYVEITNISTEPIDMTGWKVEYSNSSGSNVKVLASLVGELSPSHYMVFASPAFSTTYPADAATPYTPLLYSGLSDSGGYIRLYSSTTDTANYPTGFMKIDEVGWLASTSISTDPLIINYSGAVSFHRCTDPSEAYVARDDNRTDFYSVDQPLLGVIGATCTDLVPVDPPDDEEEQPDESEEPPTLNTCDGLVISELLPNPAGTDSGNEFIELHNTTTEALPLLGCRLEVAGGTSYVITTEDLLGAGARIVLGDTLTGITLVNSQTATLFLIGENNSEVSTATYIADLADDQSWALFDDTYTATYTPTPGLPNVLTAYKPCDQGYIRSAETGRCVAEVSSADTPLESCLAGYERNPNTNRCRKIVVDTQTSCAPGQTRNPETNRCRSISTTAVLSACTEGQERNPDTNRCRKVDTGSELIPCPTGQERNPDTNRCRTVEQLGSDSFAPASDIPTTQSASTLPVGMIAIGSVGYAFYEWRREFLDVIGGLWKKFRRR